MSRIDSTTTYSGAVSGAAPVDGTSSSGGTAGASLLPEPDVALAMSGDPGAELAALMVKNGSEQRKIEQSARNVQEEIARREDDAEVEAMRQKADATRSAGIAEGFGMIAQGGLDIGGGVSGSSRWQAIAKGGGEIANAGGRITGSVYQSSGYGADADAAHHKGAAQAARAAADDLRDAKKDAEDLVSAAIQFYRDYTAGKASEQGAALHRS